MTANGSPRVPVFSLGERIRKVREDLGISQQQLADQLGVDRKTIGNWEGGRNQPRYRDLMLISSIADVSLEWLAGDLFRPRAVSASAARDTAIRRQISPGDTHQYVSWPPQRALTHRHRRPVAVPQAA